ncbi:MAG TPA: serine/threonine-protein kinase [Polyangiaceae bacterium]|nr:serine/threonine-protein kinase [Polyangiaceae bacterium]
MSDGALAPGTLLAGKFRVVCRLGEGGMGSVYEIEHELTKHRRALKLLHKSMAAMPSVVERFLREASAAGRVGNPHIVETFDAGVLDTGEPYLVMEILRGQPLSSRIATGKMPILEVVDLIGQAAGGVQAAHNAGIVHRDLKPDNLFITEGSDGRPFVKILDFGISKFDPQKTGGLQLTQEGAALGTPYYMPPEQIRGEGSLDARADVYALGVILYECLTGVRPFEAETLAHLAILIHTGQPKPLSEHRPDLPAGFASLVHGAMATDRGQRIQSAGELCSLLEHYGPVGYRSQIRNSPLPPPSVVPARALSTSAAGISLRPAAPLKPPRSVLLWASMLGLGTAAALGGALWLRTRSAPAESSGAAPSQQPTAGAVVPGLPVVREPAVPSSANAVVPPPSVAPALADSAPPTAPAASSARAAQSTLGSAAPRVALPRMGRADERGLAKDNPFK